MKKIVTKVIKNFLKQFDIAVIHHSVLEDVLEQLNRNVAAGRTIEVLQQLNDANAQELLRYLGRSKSQLRQDLFVLSRLSYKKNGYFVEFGATDGNDLSNTYLLEKEFGWSGILAEPAKIWHEELKKNRSCNIETDCVWKDSTSTLTFNQCATAELSTIASYSNIDGRGQARKEGATYNVKTISLNDLLSKYNAPQHIDYLSIDTEGSEYEILSHFDFSKHSFQIITCEHNYSPMREKLFALLSQQGYQRVLEKVSLFDDWYIKSTPQQP